MSDIIGCKYRNIVYNRFWRDFKIGYWIKEQQIKSIWKEIDCICSDWKEEYRMSLVLIEENRSLSDTIVLNWELFDKIGMSTWVVEYQHERRISAWKKECGSVWNFEIGQSANCKIDSFFRKYKLNLARDFNQGTLKLTDLNFAMVYAIEINFKVDNVDNFVVSKN